MRTLAIMLLWTVPVSAQIPVTALQYKRALIGNARIVWGLDAPSSAIAAQVHTESAFRSDARSPYAHGLSQFTLETSDWISKKFPELADNNPYEPSWALRAIAIYDKYLYDRMTATDRCNKYAMALSSYNGGEGNLIKQKRAAKANGKDPERWFGSVENTRVRAQWAHDENRNYPRRVLLVLQPLYVKANWGAGVDCRGIV